MQRFSENYLDLQEDNGLRRLEDEQLWSGFSLFHRTVTFLKYIDVYIYMHRVFIITVLDLATQTMN